MEWINIKDSIPEKNEWVLVFSDNWANEKKFHVALVSCVYEGGISFEIGANPYDCELSTDCNNVTHWMPLPNPPEVKYDYEGKPTCTCNWDGWTSIYDWPEERKNRNIPLSLPNISGKYLVRIQDNSGDMFECEKFFNMIPRIDVGGYFSPLKEYECHWEDETWKDGSPYAWKEIKNEM